MFRFRIAVVTVWLLGAIGGIAYSQYQNIPWPVALPVLAAVLVELALYVTLAFPEVRDRCRAWGHRLPLLLVTSAFVPYLIATAPTGTLRPTGAGILAACVIPLVFWFRWLPRGVLADLGFLVFVAAVYLLKPFINIYPPPVEGFRIDFLGQLMWIRLGIASALWFREVEGTGFGFWPEKREWLIGLRHFVLLMPLGMALMYGLEFARFEPAEGWWWKWPATFVGILWVVALGEEFFFRGLLQRWLTGWIGERLGLVGAAVLFGVAHLSFREFPNWRFAVIAAVAGWFYGRAFLLGNGIRGAMVAHALTVATWRTMFR